jgi:hypothetical protein
MGTYVLKYFTALTPLESARTWQLVATWFFLTTIPEPVPVTPFLKVTQM